MQHCTSGTTLFNLLMVWVCTFCVVQLPVVIEGGIAQSAEFAMTGEFLTIAVDPVTRSLFASEFTKHRVFRYEPPELLSASSTAIAVIGQPNLTATLGQQPPSVNSLNYPRGLWVDSQGTLWIVDQNNNRVLWFRNAGSLPNQPSADGVIGQTNFTAQVIASGGNRLSNPGSVCVVSNTLWIADSSNHRVLRFNNADSLPQFDAFADAVIGQPDFMANSASMSPQGMGPPTVVRYVINVGLFVNDGMYQRVVYYPVAEAQKQFGATAAYEYGRFNFSSTADPPIEYQTLAPYGLAIASDGTLFVSGQLNNNRVLMFPPVPPTADLTRPVAVFGQPDLTTGTPGASLNQMNSPFEIYYDDPSNSLWVADFPNTRMLKFSNVLPKVLNNNNTAPTVDLGFNLRTPNFNLAIPESTYGNSSDRPVVSTNFEGITEIPSGVTGPFIPDGYSIITTTDPNNNVQFTFTTNQPADLDIQYTLFATPTQLSSAGVDFVGQPGSLKMAIAIRNWNFTSNSSQLELTLSVVVAPPVTSMTMTETTGLTIYTLYSSSISTTTIRLLKFCVIDNTTNTPITFDLTEVSTSANATTYSLVIRFPYFAGNVFYDPDFSVVVNTNDGGDGDDVGWLPYLSIIAVVFIPLIMIVVVVVVVTYCSVKKYRQRMADDRRLHQINY